MCTEFTGCIGSVGCKATSDLSVVSFIGQLSPIINQSTIKGWYWLSSRYVCVHCRMHDYMHMFMGTYVHCVLGVWYTVSGVWCVVCGVRVFARVVLCLLLGAAFSSGSCSESMRTKRKLAHSSRAGGRACGRVWGYAGGGSVSICFLSPFRVFHH